MSIYCPHCGVPVQIEASCSTLRVRQAVFLQAERLGSQIVCRHCQTGFLFTRFPAPQGDAAILPLELPHDELQDAVA